MYKEKLKILDSYLKSGLTNILIEDMPKEIFEDEIILEFNCTIDDLNGHYEGIEFMPPVWYQNLIKNNKKILVINDINKLPIEEQPKFGEILKYKKVSTFDLPKDCIVIVLVNNLKENKICEEVYSLLAHI